LSGDNRHHVVFLALQRWLTRALCSARDIVDKASDGQVAGLKTWAVET
jgi:hypothetical protein